MLTEELESALLERFPFEDAESWDRTGMTVGDPKGQVSSVAVALDPTVRAIKTAKERGCNVLVCHHPLFLDAPDDFRPAASSSVASGAGVYTAVLEGVAVMGFHTALDVSPLAAAVLPSLLDLQHHGVLVPVADAPLRGYGQICGVPDTQPITLADLAARCERVFGRSARVWGNPTMEVSSVVTGTGSISDLLAPSYENEISAIVGGEVKYHAALDASEAGLGIIEVGHDVSELPLCRVLVSSIESIAEERFSVIDISDGANWR